MVLRVPFSEGHLTTMQCIVLGYFRTSFRCNITCLICFAIELDSNQNIYSKHPKVLEKPLRGFIVVDLQIAKS